MGKLFLLPPQPPYWNVVHAPSAESYAHRVVYSVHEPGSFSRKQYSEAQRNYINNSDWCSLHPLFQSEFIRQFYLLFNYFVSSLVGKAYSYTSLVVGRKSLGAILKLDQVFCKVYGTWSERLELRVFSDCSSDCGGLQNLVALIFALLLRCEVVAVAAASTEVEWTTSVSLLSANHFISIVIGSSIPVF